MSVKTAGTGFFQIPTAPAGLTAVAQSASANTLGSAVSFGNSPSAMYITGVTIGVATTQTPTYVQIQILVAASVVASVLVPYGVSAAAAASVVTGYRQIYPPIPVANAAAITVKSASSVASAVGWGVSLECIAQANVVDDGVAQSANVTQWNGTNVATPATAGIPDVNVKNINNVAAATPGAAGGVLISGSNSGTTTLGALTITGATTHTGNVVLSDGLTISAPSTGNRAGLDIAGNGTGAALKLVAGATGVGFSIAGGGTSGDGIKVTTTSGHGVNLAPVGTSMHGILSTGGNGGTSDGIKAVAGTGGVDIRGNITGNLVGTVSILTTYTGNTPQTGDAFAIVKSGGTGDNAAIKTKTDFLPSVTAGAAGGVFIAGTNAATTITTALTTTFTGNLTGSAASVSGAVGSVAAAVTVGTNNDKTGYSLTQAFPANFSAFAITAGGAVTAGTVSDKTGYSLVAGYDLAKTAAQAGDAMTLTAAYNAAKTAAQAGDAMALTGGERTSLAGVIHTTAIVESYRANGAVPTPAQFMSEVLAHLGESTISGTTKTVNKLDHATSAATFTLDSATAPASITRAT